MRLFKLIILNKATKGHDYDVNIYWIYDRKVVKKQYQVPLSRGHVTARKLSSHWAELWIDGKFNCTMSCADAQAWLDKMEGSRG